MNIGIIRKNAGAQLIGNIATLDLNVRVELRKVLSNNPKMPAYEVMANKPGGVPVSIGAVWARVANGTGEAFYTGTLNDPSMGKPLPIALFNISKGENAGGYAVVWDNGKRSKSAVTGEEQSEQPAQDGLGESTAEHEAESQLG
jgi:uncharacterized protein (DUF736 family)